MQSCAAALLNLICRIIPDMQHMPMPRLAHEKDTTTLEQSVAAQCQVTCVGHVWIYECVELVAFGAHVSSHWDSRPLTFCKQLAV